MKSTSFVNFNCTFHLQADAVVLCYSAVERGSFENVEYKWWRELQCPIRRGHVPVILVATKSDLRESSATATPVTPPVTTVEGIQLCNRINATAFLECSARTQTNIAEVIYESVRAAVRFSVQAELGHDHPDGDSSGDEREDEGERRGSYWWESSGKQKKKKRRRGNPCSRQNSLRLLFRKLF